MRAFSRFNPSLGRTCLSIQKYVPSFNQDLSIITCISYFLFTASVIEGTIFCAHAGLSPHLYDLDLVSTQPQTNTV